MDHLRCAAHIDPTQQQRFSEITIRALREIFPSLLGEVKDSASPKKALAGDGDWATIKEILEWEIDTHWGTLALSSKRPLKLISIL